MSELDQILASIKTAETTQAKRRRAWDPRTPGVRLISVSLTDGSWHHEGRRFQRDSMVKLFAGILRREQNDYYLVTPAEKLRIQVEDAPFVAVLVEQLNDSGTTAIVFTTNIGERIVVDHDTRIYVSKSIHRRNNRDLIFTCVTASRH